MHTPIGRKSVGAFLLKIFVHFVLFCSFSSNSVNAFAGPFSSLWTVSRTFSNGGFEGDIKVPVRSPTSGGWKMTVTFDKPVKGFQMWKGRVSDVAPDFTYYVIANQPWNGNIHGPTFDFHVLGYAQNGPPSLTVTFQGQVHGEDLGPKRSGSNDDEPEFVTDYKKVVELSLLFFEAQRSGKMPADNRIPWKLDSALYDGGAEGVDLTGGYYIGGDYVKFGFPMAFAVTQLAWGGLAFAGGYQQAGETINLYKAIKWGTDYFMKAHPQESELYGMVGDPTIDHSHWESGGSINWRRPAYKLTTNEPGSDLAAETSAALAAAGLLFSTVAAEYSAELIRHAEQLYQFADFNRGRYDGFSIPGAAGFYPSTDYGDELVWAAIWLHKATYKQAYLDEAIAKYTEFNLAKKNTETGLTYDNKILAIQLLLSEITGEYDLYMTPVAEFCNQWSSRSAPKSPDGLLSMKKLKNKMIFVANTAFLCALASEQTLDPAQTSAYQDLAKQQVAEALGKGTGVSYMVGYGQDYPKRLHDRDSSCPSPPLQCGWGFFGSPGSNTYELTGALVGGPDASGNLVDSRKNFVGNQPHILHNSAFQSVAAGLLFLEGIATGGALVALDPQEIANRVFAGAVVSKLDACSSHPCQNNGQCSSVEGFNYLCTCPDNVFGINCEHRMIPQVKWVNTWGNGAEIQLKLPSLQPTGDWQLRMTFPHDCPLTQLDTWNACLNIPESSLDSRQVIFQQIGWQEQKDFIGLRFQFSEARFLRNCFREESYRFVVVEKGTPSLKWASPETCPKQLPHPLEGSGSGFDEPLLPVATMQAIVPPERIPITSVFTQPSINEINPITLPAVNVPLATQAPVIQPLANQPHATQAPVFLPPATNPDSTAKRPTLRWMSQWGSGGQGQIELGGTKPNAEGRWTLTMRLPPGCLLDSIQFWEVCTVEAMSDPYNGVVVFEQISWQLHKSSIGMMAHFHVVNGAASSSCLQSERYAFVYQASSLAHNRDPDSCRKEYKDLRKVSLSRDGKVSPDGGTNAGTGDVNSQPGPSISPDQAWIPRDTENLVPAVNRLRATVESNSEVNVMWGINPGFIDSMEITFHPAPANEGTLTATLGDLGIKKSSSSSSVLEAISSSIQVPTSSTSIKLRDLLPGMRYQISAKLFSGKQEGPVSSVFITTHPLDVTGLKATSIGGNSITLSWLQPKGIHENYKISYFPQGNTGNPPSPFVVSGDLTTATVTGLSGNTDFIFTMATKAENTMSDGVYSFAKTVPDQCLAITCAANQVCENQRTESKCVCRPGYSGTPCADIDECSTGGHVCHDDATCQNTIGSFSCQCKPGYVGDGSACYDVDECQATPRPCSGPCLNTEGSFRCSCDAGYTGALDQCIDIDECATGLATCSSPSTCRNTEGSYECVCADGSALVDGECVDVDECQTNRHNCDATAVCVDMVGGFLCVCAKGYALIGTGCQDLDECAISTHMCHAMATCRNVIGGYQCTCNSGYQGDGRLCILSEGANPAPVTPIPTVQSAGGDECSSGTHNCDAQATCIDTQQSFDCVCFSGYTGDGRTCTDIDECANGDHSCDPNASCRNMIGGHGCACNTGYQGDGWTCTLSVAVVPVDECALGLHNCDVNALCFDTSQSFACLCNAGFVGDGTQCTAVTSAPPTTAAATPVDECALGLHNCDVNALCFDTSQSFACLCNAGFVGDGTQCTVVTSAPPTTAAATPVDECALGLHNCDVNALCFDTSQSFACICNAGYVGDGTLCTSTVAVVPVDECALGLHNCDVNALCFDTSQSFACLCNAGFVGDGTQCTVVTSAPPTTAAATPVDECALGLHNCDVNALCIDTSLSFACICNAGYVGDGTLCTSTAVTSSPPTTAAVTPLDECALSLHNCDVNALCIDTSQSFACFCNAGFVGDGTLCTVVTSAPPTTAAATPVDECALGLHNCDVNALCFDTSQSFACICNAGYVGDGTLCTAVTTASPSAPVDECALALHNCDVNALCVDTSQSFMCLCNAGFLGDGTLCTDINECLSGTDSCDAQATCSNTGGSYTCACNPGFQGDGVTCTAVIASPATPIDECALGLHNCDVNALCIDTSQSFECRCNPGWGLVDGRCDDVDECVTSQHDCDANAVCSNTQGSFVCFCLPSFQGNGTHCDDIDECLSPLTNQCDANASCINTQGSYQCNCAAGFQGDGRACSDVDECLLDPVLTGCDQNASCLNTPGSFICSCPIGFHGDGTECRDINECDSREACHESALCVNTHGSYSCDCDEGYEGSGSSCYDVDECENREACHESALCVNTHGSFSCECEEGYEGSGSSCSDINECLFTNHDCHENAVCKNTHGTYSCECHEGFYGNGTHCGDYDECTRESHGCHVNAYCLNIMGSYLCDCIVGYHGNGSHCQDVDECSLSSHDCHVKAVCVNIEGSYSCECRPGYQGNSAHCEDINECNLEFHDCHMNADCENTQGSYNCVCREGYHGDGVSCRDVDECKNSSNKCDRLTSTCQNSVGSYKCVCKVGFTRDSHGVCNDINECRHQSLHRCHDNADCLNSRGSYQCICKTSFSGNGTHCKPSLSHVTCRPRDVIFLLDRTSDVTTYHDVLEFVRKVTFRLNAQPDGVQVAVATFASRPTPLVWLRRGISFSSIDQQLRKAEVAGPERNGERNLAKALRWTRKRFLANSKGKTRDHVPTSVVVMTSGPPGDVMFGEMPIYDKLNIDVKFVAIGVDESLRNSSFNKTFSNKKLINVRDSGDLPAVHRRMMKSLCLTSNSVGYRSVARPSKAPIISADCPSQSSLDLIFALDSRSGIGEKGRILVNKFVESVTDQFPISETGTRVGIVQFALKSKQLLNLEEGTARKNITDALRRLGRGQKLGAAMQFLQYTTLRPVMGRRKDKRAVILLITGSRTSTTSDELARWRKSFDSANTRVISIGLGSSEREKLLALTGSEENSYRLGGFADLNRELAKSVVSRICYLTS